MTECNNADVRDLLPDHVAGTLPVAQQTRVESHVTSCAACRDEMALLRVVRSVRPRAVAIDVSRIVAALPRGTATSVVPALHLVRDEYETASPEPIVRQAAPAAVDIASRRRPGRSAAWRIAAAIGVTVIGSWSVLSVRDDGRGVGSEGRVAEGSAPVGAGTSDLPRGETLAARAMLGDSGAVRSRPANPAAAAAGLSLGDLSEYSDEDLQGVLDRLDNWDGAASADPLPTLPIVSVTRGTL